MKISRHPFTQHLNSPLWSAMLISFLYTLLSLGMIFQHDRFPRTPAYSILLEMLDIRVWGVLYGTVAFLLFIYMFILPNKITATIAHTMAIALTSFWLLAFFIRWWSDDSTTPVVAILWLGLLLVLIRSSTFVSAALAFVRETNDTN